MRPSLHVEPIGLLNIARHYVRELIYGANDGIITTFAVVAGSAGVRQRQAGCGHGGLRLRRSRLPWDLRGIMVARATIVTAVTASGRRLRNEIILRVDGGVCPAVR